MRVSYLLLLFASPGRRFLLGHPRPRALVQKVERQLAVAQDLVVKGADVEPGSQLAGGVAAQLFHLELAELVDWRRPGLDDVAVDLDRNVLLGPGGVGLAIVDRL